MENIVYKCIDLENIVCKCIDLDGIISECPRIVWNHSVCTHWGKERGSVWVSQGLCVPCQGATRYRAEHWVLTFIQSRWHPDHPSLTHLPDSMMVLPISTQLWALTETIYCLLGWCLRVRVDLFYYGKMGLSSAGVKFLPLNSSTHVNPFQVRKKAENNRGKEDQESLSFTTSWMREKFFIRFLRCFANTLLNMHMTINQYYYFHFYRWGN